MIAANVPVVPGSDGLVTTISDAKQIAKEIGYPVIIKSYCRWWWKKVYEC